MTSFTHAMVIVEDKHSSYCALQRLIQSYSAELQRLTIYRLSPTMHDVAQQQSERDAINAVLSEFSSNIKVEIVFYARVFNNTDFDSILLGLKPDVIVKMHSGQRFFEGFFKDKLEQYLISSSTYPIWIVKPHVWDETIQVLACLDLDDDTPANHQLNTRILASGDSMARQLSGDLHVIDCFFGEVCSMSFEQEDSGEFKRTTSVKLQHQQLIDAYVADYSVADNGVHLIAGTPDFAIPDLVSELHAELVVIGNNVDRGILAKLFGDTALSLVKDIVCDVLVVKP
jgi:universal stress protein E